jgi:hypothetical protein
MSAQRGSFFRYFGLKASRGSLKNQAKHAARFPPKAKVGCSNHLGRANEIIVRKSGKPDLRGEVKRISRP